MPIHEMLATKGTYHNRTFMILYVWHLSSPLSASLLSLLYHDPSDSESGDEKKNKEANTIKQNIHRLALILSKYVFIIAGRARI